MECCAIRAGDDLEAAMNEGAQADVVDPPTTADRLRRMFTHADRGNTTDAVTDVLREAILLGVLMPGSWLREDELARALKVSRTPVREALRRLSDEGLTQRAANRGTVVAPMTVDEILAVYAVRESLEGLAARIAAQRRPPGLVEELRAVHQEMLRESIDAEERARLNLDFHRIIREAAGNPYLSRFLTQVEHAVRRFGTTTLAQPGRGDSALNEHYGILEAIAVGDPDLAEKRAVEHMHRAREARLKHLLTM